MSLDFSRNIFYKLTMLMRTLKFSITGDQISRFSNGEVYTLRPKSNRNYADLLSDAKPLITVNLSL
jgi:hypothetical protein